MRFCQRSFAVNSLNTGAIAFTLITSIIIVVACLIITSNSLRMYEFSVFYDYQDICF